MWNHRDVQRIGRSAHRNVATGLGYCEASSRVSREIWAAEWTGGISGIGRAVGDLPTRKINRNHSTQVCGGYEIDVSRTQYGIGRHHCRIRKSLKNRCSLQIHIGHGIGERYRCVSTIAANGNINRNFGQRHNLVGMAHRVVDMQLVGITRDENDPVEREAVLRVEWAERQASHLRLTATAQRQGHQNRRIRELKPKYNLRSMRYYPQSISTAQVLGVGSTITQLHKRIRQISCGEAMCPNCTVNTSALAFDGSYLWLGYSTGNTSSVYKLAVEGMGAGNVCGRRKSSKHRV